MYIYIYMRVKILSYTAIYPTYPCIHAQILLLTMNAYSLQHSEHAKSFCPVLLLWRRQVNKHSAKSIASTGAFSRLLLVLHLSTN